MKLWLFAIKYCNDDFIHFSFFKREGGENVFFHTCLQPQMTNTIVLPIRLQLMLRLRCLPTANAPLHKHAHATATPAHPLTSALQPTPLPLLT
jgi:hypothetical protein